MPTAGHNGGWCKTRDHHPGVGRQGQPVTAAPAQRGHGHPVGDPARQQDAVQAARERGRSWNQLAITVGVSRRAAWQRFAGKVRH